MYPCGRWQHPYSIHSWLLEALPLVQALVDAAYGNEQLKGHCEGDSIPSTRTSNPGPGSNVKSSFKKQKFEFEFSEMRFLRNISFGYRWKERPRRRDRRNDRSFKIWKILIQIFPDSYRDTRKALEIVQIFHGKQLPEAGIPEFRKATTLREGLWTLACYVIVLLTV